MEEVAAVAAAQGIPVDAGRIPAAVDESLRTLGPFKTSMLQDLERGRRLEHDALNGAVVRAAERVGAPAPINRTLWRLLAAVTPRQDGG
jgi:2-dehydropantoate 2-reductase